jgi:uncharacterized protein YhjY with autotransporter beta-barrel domain
MASYSRFDGDSTRRVDLAPYGGSFSATLNGDPDVTMWTAGLHAGYRHQVGTNSLFTSYVNLDWADAELNSFAERTANGDAGAELRLVGSSSSHLFMTSGLKWTGRLGGVTPEVDLGYRYRFGEKRSMVIASEIGGEDGAFATVSAAQKRGSFLAGVSLGGRVGPVDLRIAYEGEYNKGFTSHSGSLRIVLPLGGNGAVAAASSSK